MVQFRNSRRKFIKYSHIVGGALALAMSSTASAEWAFSAGPTPNAYVLTNGMTLELQCDRIRFAPAGLRRCQDIANKQGLSIRFMKNGSKEAGSFQAGRENADFQIVDNFPVEVIVSRIERITTSFWNRSEQTLLYLSMIDQDVSYGIFDLKGSAAAINSLRSACVASGESPCTSMRRRREWFIAAVGPSSARSNTGSSASRRVNGMLASQSMVKPFAP